MVSLYVHTYRHIRIYLLCVFLVIGKEDDEDDDTLKDVPLLVNERKIRLLDNGDTVNRGETLLVHAISPQGELLCIHVYVNILLSMFVHT